MDKVSTHYSLINYRSDIDGLRALAVMAVVLYHAFPKYVKGGFVGVDIFFVISGYLIGFILFKNFDAKNLCLYTFYSRRVKRIFPALLLVLVFCLVFGWFSLTDVEYTRLGLHAKASTLFYTNFALAKESGYFDVSAHTKPLMHLWSLALEEQFYIVCPLLLYFATKKGLNIISICVSIILISFIISIQTLHKHPVEAFYYPLCRIWELTSGVLLAYLAYKKVEIPKKTKKIINRWVNLIVYKHDSLHSQKTLVEVLAWLGLVINLCTIFCLKRTSHFPGWYAILPVVGTVLIIVAGENTWVNKNILSNKVCVKIGLISYPLYLWHWCLLSFIWILEGQNPEKKIITGALLISFVLAWMTYKVIENPIRKAKDSKFIPFTLVMLFILVGFGAYKIVINKGYSARKANLMNNMPLLPQNDERFMNLRVLCSSPLNVGTGLSDIHCIINSDKPQFLIMGDSHALSLAYSTAINHDLDIAMLSLAGQPPYISYISYVKTIQNRDDHIRNLKLFNSYLDAMLTSYNSIEYVVLISRGPVYFSGSGFGIETKDLNFKYVLENIYNDKPQVESKEAFVEGYVEMIEFLLLKGKKVILAVDFPELGEDPSLCLKRLLSLTGRPSKDCIIDRKVVDARQAEYRTLIQKIQNRIPGLLVYDPIPAFCDQEKCYGKSSGVIYYGDDDHLNLEGSRLLGSHFKNWFLKEAIRDHN